MNEEENDGTIFSMLAPQTEFDGDLTTKAALYQRVLQKVVQKNQFFGGGECNHLSAKNENFSISLLQHVLFLSKFCYQQKE